MHELSRIEKVLARADAIVKPYLKSLQHAKLAESPTVKRVLALAHAVLPQRMLRWMHMGEGAMEKGGGPVVAQDVFQPTKPRLQSSAHAAKFSTAKADLDAGTTGARASIRSQISPYFPHAGGSESERGAQDFGQEITKSVGDMVSSLGDSMGKLFEQPGGNEAEPLLSPRRGVIIA